MTVVEKIEAEIAALEAQAAQILANANFINGAKQALHSLLTHVKAEEAVVAPKVDNVLKTEIDKVIR